MTSQPPIVESFGIIPVDFTRATPRYLLVQHRRGHWGFPKGKPDGDSAETPLATALRELEEETGLTDVRIIETAPLVEQYMMPRKNGEKVLKRVTYYIGFVSHTRVAIPRDELSDYAWGDEAATRKKLTFDESKQVLTQVVRILKKTNL